VVSEVHARNGATEGDTPTQGRILVRELDERVGMERLIAEHLTDA
jgi:hypothetical protein